MSTTFIDFGPDLRAREAPSSGEKVLWVHGYTIDSSLWEDLWALLPDFHHIAVDLPGHGQSRALGDGEDLHGFGSSLAEAAIASGARHVVGLSLGSVIALEIVRSRPTSFATLTLGAPARGRGPADPGAGERYRQMMQLYWTTGVGPWLAELWMTSPPDIFTHAQKHPRLWARLREVIGRHSFAELGGRGISHLALDPQPLEGMGAISASTLLLVGEHEMEAFKETARELHQAIPRAEIRTLAGAGHLCMLEAPEAAAAAMGDHLRRAALK